MKEVLFVCVRNSGRSQMAEAFFNRLAEERGLDVRAGSMSSFTESRRRWLASSKAASP